MPAEMSPTGNQDLMTAIDSVMGSLNLVSCVLHIHSLLYICTLNSGNAAANAALAKEFAANL